MGETSLSDYAYGNSRQSFRGSGEATSIKISSKSTFGAEVTQKSPRTRYSRTPAPEAASKEIVPVGRAGRPEHTIDLSMALAFAFGSGGKNLNFELYRNPSKGFILRQTSVGFGDIEGRHNSGRLPFLSQLHIGEVSRGAQKLNNILKACSNGLSFDRNSIDIGRELLKGAIDLEESLRMLVNLQEASDYMVSTQRNKVTLLQEKEDDEPSSPEVEQRIIPSGPRFSFDKPSRYSREDAREVAQFSILEKNTRALSCTGKPKTPQPKFAKSSSNASVHSVSHRRSASCGPTFKPDTPPSSARSRDSHSAELWSSSDSTTPAALASRHRSSTSQNTNNTKQLSSQISSEREKVRIPNVIAKLMGLEELPPPNTQSKDSEVQRDLKSKQGMGTGKNLRQNTEGIMEGVDLATLSEKSAPRKGGQRKVLQEKGGIANQANKPPEVVQSKGKTELKTQNMENTGLVSKSLQKLHFKIDQQMNLTDVDRNQEILAKKEVLFYDTTNPKEQKNKAKVEQMLRDIQKPVLEFGSETNTPQPYRRSANDEDTKHDSAGTKRNLVQNEQRNAKKGLLMQGHQLKPTNENESKQLRVVHGSESEYGGAATEIEHTAKNKMKFEKMRKSCLTPKNTKSVHRRSSENLVLKNQTIIASKRSTTDAVDKKQVKESRNSSHLEKVIICSRRAINHDIHSGSLEEKRFLRTGSKSDKEKVVPLIPAGEITGPVHLPSAEKADITKAAASRENPKTTEEETERVRSPKARRGHPLRQQTSVLEELKQRRKERIREAEEATVSPHTPNLEQHLQEKAETTSLPCSHVIDDCGPPKRIDENINTDTGSYDIIIDAAAVQQHPEILPKGAPELQSFDLKANQTPGSTDNRHISNYYNSLSRQNQAVLEFNGQGSLTEKEKHLRQIVINSQLFLSTAQALFKLKIPVSIIQDSKKTCQNAESKLVLDCGYEVMRRKGKRRELTFHSPMKLSSATVKVRCLDDLIKDLNNDLEILKFPGVNEGDNYDTAELLHDMLERDIQNRIPDLNCMWDFGWNSMMFTNSEKDEVIRDVEKHVLNGLISEIARDLLNVSIII